MNRTRGPAGRLAAPTALLLVAGCSPGASDAPALSEGSTSAAPAEAEGLDRRWIGIRDVEVRAPRAWGFDYETLRPDCIDPRHPRRGSWTRDVPDAPSVMLGTPNRVVPAIGCRRHRQPGDPSPAFGELPFSLWQPFVKLEQARPDLGSPTLVDGRWHYRGWELTRHTAHGVQVTVLAPPDRPSLGRHVVRSARQVETTSVGCAPTSPVQAVMFSRPSGAPIPAADTVGAVAVCQYSRLRSGRGLEGSRRITGQAARDLVEAIHDAPRSGGPDTPQHCLSTMYGDSAIALRFFADPRETTNPLAEAYVYYDWCFGNGIFDPEGARQLTRANCPPLFAQPPVSFWSGQRVVAQVCGPLA